MIFEGKHLTGQVVVNDNLWLAECHVQDATLIVNGDLYVERPSVFEKVALVVSGDLVIKPPTTITGDVNAKVLAAHNELTVEGSVEADTVLTMGESVFRRVKTRIATFNGTVVAETIEANAITVDGDLIADKVDAQTVIADRGSVLVKDLTHTAVTAPLIGNYGDQTLDTQRLNFRWARPMVTPPKTMSIPDMIAGGIAALEHHAPGLPTIHLDRIRGIQQCADLTDMYMDMYTDLKAMYDRLTPAGKQFVDCVEQHGFPGNYWRF